MDENVEKDEKATMEASATFVSSCELCCLLDWLVTATLEPQFSHL